MTSLFERLNDNEIILLDGGVSTEIQKRGVAMDSDVWSGLAHKSHPEVVLQVHEDYIRAGAQVITANTYSTARHVLESVDMGDEVRAINTEAVQLAKKARDNSAKDETWIAGSMSSMAPFNSPQEVANGEKVAQNYQELAEIIAEAGVDLIITEMMRDAVNAKLVIEAALSTGLPVWIGYSAMMSDDGKSVQTWHWKNSLPSVDFEELVEAVSPLGGDAAGIMHSQVRDTPPALEILGRHWSGPKLAYAETGEIEKPDWNFKEICTPNEYAAEIEGWINNYGVQIIGGCCGTGPEHIRILMRPDALSIPPRLGKYGEVARKMETGPVFSLSAAGDLHMRYTIRKKNIVWADNPETKSAVKLLNQILTGDSDFVFQILLEPGMGLISNNVLHNRNAFVDNEKNSRHFFRSRYFERLRGTGVSEVYFSL